MFIYQYRSPAAITDLRAAGNPLIYVNQVCYNI